MISLPWLRVPGDLLDRDEKEQIAWIFVLGRWHQGKAFTHADLREITGWGAGKVVSFIKTVQQWAKDNGGAGPEQERSKTGVKSEQPTQEKAAQNRTNGVKSEQDRSKIGVSAPENQPPPPPLEPLKKEKEIKNSQIPPTPQTQASPSEPAGEGLGGKENLDFLSRPDREALAKHGIKTVAGLKAAEARNPIRYSKGVGQARADRILAALAAHEGKPFISDSTDSIDDVLANFWKEQPNGPKHATA